MWETRHATVVGVRRGRVGGEDVWETRNDTDVEVRRGRVGEREACRSAARWRCGRRGRAANPDDEGTPQRPRTDPSAAAPEQEGESYTLVSSST